MKPWHWMDVAFYLAIAGYLAAHPHRSAHYAIGMAIAAVGFTLWITARLQLGRSFSVTAQATRLVTTGLYSRLRHPVYCFGHLAITGMVIATGIWLLLIGVAFGALFQWARIRKEEAVLESAFGDEYRRYRATTWF